MSMEKDWYIKNIENIQDIKDKLTDKELLFVYWYIANHYEDFTADECESLYNFLSYVDEKFLKDEK